MAKRNSAVDGARQRVKVGVAGTLIAAVLVALGGTAVIFQTGQPAPTGPTEPSMHGPDQGTMLPVTIPSNKEPSPVPPERKATSKDQPKEEPKGKPKPPPFDPPPAPG